MEHELASSYMEYGAPNVTPPKFGRSTYALCISQAFGA